MNNVNEEMKEELVHYGVLGMKWGKRKGNAASAQRKADRKADREKRKSMKKDVKKRRLLSDADLNKKLERLKKEKQLREITSEEISPGKRFVKNILSSSGTKVATALVTGAALYAVKTKMTKEFDIKELASYMTPKPKNK